MPIGAGVGHTVVDLHVSGAVTMPATVETKKSDQEQETQQTPDHGNRLFRLNTTRISSSTGLSPGGIGRADLSAS